jgi:hypothetical protein
VDDSKDQRESLQVRIDALNAKRAKVSGSAKGKITRDLNKLMDELARLG